MRKILITTLLFCSLSLNAQNLSDSDKIAGLTRFQVEVKYNFVFYNKLKFDWDSLCTAHIPKILATKTTNEYYNELRRLCAKLEDGHTKILVKNSTNIDDWIAPIPIKTRMYNKRIFVKEVMSSHLVNKGIVKGVEIVKINKQNAYEYAEENVKPYISSSTPQWLKHETFNSFELTKGIKGDILNIEIKDKKGKIIKLDISRKIDWDLIDKSPLEYKTVENNIGLLRVNTFMGNSFSKDFNEIYESIIKSEALIIDLRDNSGGNSNLADYILRHLSKTPIKTSTWSSPMYIAVHGSWGYPQQWYSNGTSYLQPINKEIYTKPVVVLINEGTFSSCEDFCAKFIGMERGKLIGTTTGGSTGNPINIDLIKGVISAIICTKKDIGPTGLDYIGSGIKPDIEIKETMSDFLNSEDIVLKEAIKQLTK